MENQTKVDLWIKKFLEKNNNSLTDFNFQGAQTLRLTNYKYDEIFYLLLKGFPLKIGNLDLTNKTLVQALDFALSKDKEDNKTQIYFDCSRNQQNKKLSSLLTQEYLYLTFGLLDYFEDNRMIIKAAPLVLLPVKLEILAHDEGFQISSINHEICLNEPLISKLIETRRIDISYPLENNFSLIEYFTYVSTKIRNYHFSVNNGCFLTSNISFNNFYAYQDFKNNQRSIVELPIVKSVAYLNPEFFNFKKVNGPRLNNQYLSLLNLDNDEYRILRRINQRENIVLRTNLLENKNHLLTNILYDFILNNKNVLLTFEEKERDSILKFIKDNSLEDFTLELSPLKTSKERLINHLLSHETLEYDEKLLNQSKIDETIDTYYLLKNNFKKFINSLRKNNEPLNLSINKAINEYFLLDNCPNIDIDIPNVDIIDEKKLSEYIKTINSFVDSIENLKCNYKDHPFYGFNNLTLDQQKYNELREKLTLFSNEFIPCSTAFSLLEKEYNIPLPLTLKSMKCILNILSLIPDCIKIPLSIFEIEDYDSIYKSLEKHNNLFDEINALRSKIISLYGEKVFLIEHTELKNKISNNLSKKDLKFYHQFCMKKTKLDDTILKNLSSNLEEYHNLNTQIDGIIKENDYFKDFYIEGRYDLDTLTAYLTNIQNFKNNCQYLEKESIHYSYKKLYLLTEDHLKRLPIYRKRCQMAFNHFLKYINFIKQYFDENLVDFTTMPINILEKRINNASKNFASINDYLNFYLSLKKTNTILPTLGDELLNYSQTSLYSSIFMKRFYYLYALSFINSNPVFKNYSEETFLKSLENYHDYNSNRLEILKALIKNNLNVNLQNNSLTIKSMNIPFLRNLKQSELMICPLEKLIFNVKTTIFSLFPIILISLKDVSELMYRNNYHFDSSIILANEDLLNVDVIPSIVRSDQAIVFDSRLIDSHNDNLLHQNNEHFLCSTLQTYNVVDYISSSYKEITLKANSYDIALKEHLITKLKDKNLLVGKNVSTPYGIIDILVKVPNSTKSTAIVIDHLNYYSIESSIDAFSKANESLNKLGFANYRIITSTYFQNENKEFEKLLNFILNNTNKEKITHKVNKPLIDVLFKEYASPERVFYQIQDKDNISLKDVYFEVIKKCAPINKQHLIESLNDSLPYISSLQINK